MAIVDAVAGLDIYAIEQEALSLENMRALREAEQTKWDQERNQQWAEWKEEEQKREKAWNADVNGSLNIGRKVIGEALYGIVNRSVAATPVAVNPLRFSA